MNWRYGGHLLRSHRLPLAGVSCITTSEPTNLHPSLHSHQTANPPLPSLYLHPLLSNPNANLQARTHAPTPTATPVPADVVTSLALDADWVVVGLSGSHIHVFSARTGVLARTLVGHEAGVWGVCLVSRGGGHKEGEEKDGRKEKGGKEEKEQVEVEDAFAAMDLRGDRSPSQPKQPSSNSSSSSSPRKSRPSRSKPCASTPSSKPTVSVDGFTTVTGKKAKKRRRSGKGGAFGSRDEDHDLVSPSLRVALGLGADSDSDVGVEDVKVEVDGRRNWEQEEDQEEDQLGVGGRGVVDEDAEHEPCWSCIFLLHMSHLLLRPFSSFLFTVSHAYTHILAPRPAPPTYVPGRQSDPCFASEGWGQPNALVVSGGCDKVVRVWDVKSGFVHFPLPSPVFQC